MILLFSSQKGGVGKTTLATNTVVELQRRGHSVVLIDSDSQQSSMRWTADREEQGTSPAVLSMFKPGNLFNTLQELAKTYDHVVVDLPGKDSQEQRTALACADIAVAPCQPSQFDADTLPLLVAVADEARNFNPSLNLKAVINRASVNPKDRDVLDTADFINELEGIELMRTVIHDRKPFKSAAALGFSVVEGPEVTHAKASLEIQHFVDEILGE